LHLVGILFPHIKEFFFTVSQQTNWRS